MNFTLGDLECLSIQKELFNGYSRVQVEMMLDKIIEDYCAMYKEKDRLLNEVAIMKETVQHYKTIEESLQHTLILAHSTGEGIKLNAIEKADNIVREAELEAQKIVEKAELKAEKIKMEYEELKNSINSFKISSASLFNSIQEKLNAPLSVAANTDKVPASINPEQDQ